MTDRAPLQTNQCVASFEFSAQVLLAVAALAALRLMVMGANKRRGKQA